MKQQTIIFDLDDTLVHCNKYFEQIVKRFTAQIVRWFAVYELHSDQIRHKQAEIDVANVNAHGFSTVHFPQSLVETYLYFSERFNRVPIEEELQWLERLGESVYEQKVEPYPHMNETLTELQNMGHLLALYTGGVEKIQRRKIAYLRLEKYFAERIFIRQHKDITTFAAILHKEEYKPEQTWMVGNSLRTDMAPALDLGVNCIHVPALTEWDYDIVEIVAKPRRAYLSLNSLREVPQAIQNYLD